MSYYSFKHFSREVSELFDQIVEYMYDKYPPDIVADEVRKFENSVVEYVERQIEKAKDELRRVDVPEWVIRRVRYSRVVEEALNKFLNAVLVQIGDKDVTDIHVDDIDFIIVYGETMGFIKIKDEWDVFEGSDEPDEIDRALYSALFLARKKEPVIVYGTHGREFVHSWGKSGIPSNVYFASDRSVAEKYWHPGGDDVLVRVKFLDPSVLMPTGEGEWKTVKNVEPSEFILHVV
jgi:hypothetical protein